MNKPKLGKLALMLATAGFLSVSSATAHASLADLFKSTQPALPPKPSGNTVIATMPIFTPTFIKAAVVSQVDKRWATLNPRYWADDLTAGYLAAKLGATVVKEKYVGDDGAHFKAVLMDDKGGLLLDSQGNQVAAMWNVLHFPNGAAVNAGNLAFYFINGPEFADVYEGNARQELAGDGITVAPGGIIGMDELKYAKLGELLPGLGISMPATLQDAEYQVILNGYTWDNGTGAFVWHAPK